MKATCITIQTKVSIYCILVAANILKHLNLPVLNSILNKDVLDGSQHIDVYAESSVMDLPMLSNAIKQELGTSEADHDVIGMNLAYEGMSGYVIVHYMN